MVVAVVSGRQITEQAVEVVPAGAPRDVWLAARQHGIGASEAAAVLGLSPWESRFSLHWRKRGVLGGVDETEQMRWGTILEAPIAAEFARRHPTVRVERVGLCAHVDRPWQLATPDRLLIDPDEGCDCPAAGCRRTGVCTAGGAVTAVLECKIDDAHHAYAWGDEGSDDIPVHYRCQVLQQLDVLGAELAYLAVLIGGTDYREYLVEYDEAEAKLIRDADAAFWADVQAERPPDVDDSPATARALRHLHPTVEDREQLVPAGLARRYHAAVAAARRADKRKQLADNQLRARLGTARRAVLADGTPVATRSVYDRKPYEVGPATVDRLLPATPKGPSS
jgi:putative phage-type endonuclease